MQAVLRLALAAFALMLAAPAGATGNASDGAATTAPPLNATLPLPADGPGGLVLGFDLPTGAAPMLSLALVGLGLVALLAGPIERMVVSVLMRSGRLDPRDVLSHPTRRRIHDLLQAAPGAHYREIQRDLALSNATLRWHLDKLEAVGLVRSKRLPGKRVYYINGGEARMRPAVLAALLRNSNAVRVLDAIRSDPGTNPTRLSRELGLNPMTVRWHVGKFVRESFVAETETGRGTALVVHPEASALVNRTLAPAPQPVALLAPA